MEDSAKPKVRVRRSRPSAPRQRATVQPIVDMEEFTKMVAGTTASAVAKAMASIVENGVKGITDEVELAEAKKEITVAVDELRKQKKYKMMLNEQENTDDPRQQFISCNGVAWLIKRGVEVIVPEGIRNVIKEAVYLRGTQDTEGNTVVKKVNRFSYSELGMA